MRAKSGQLDAAIDDYAGSAAILCSEGLRPTLARVLRGWGTALLASGQHEEGRDRLERARQLFLEMGIEREAEELRRQLSTA